ncbi:MAG: hypothetical protein HY611_01310 [Elusimicrobia bacterium]|nr:hypothetical protein [Elusimicrobiota bacterium]
MPQILIVIADPYSRQEMTVLAEQMGYGALQAKDGPSALEILRETLPDVLLLHEEFPGAPSCASWMRSVQQEFPLLPVIVCLKSRDAGRAVDFLKLGALDCLAPPWSQETVGPCLRKAVRLKGTHLDLLMDERRPPALSRKAVALVAGALLLLVAGVISLRSYRWPAEEISHASALWDLPYSHPSGLAAGPRPRAEGTGRMEPQSGVSSSAEGAAAKGSIWIADWFSQSIYRHRPSDLKLEKAYFFAHDPPAALAFAEGALWTVTVSGFFQKHLLDAQLTAVSRFKAPGAQIAGLGYDGIYLWSCDVGAGVLRKHLMDNQLTVLSEISYAGGKPAAVAFDGTAMWTLDASRSALLKHDLLSPGKILAEAPLPEYQGNAWTPGGLLWDGKNFWTVGERKGKTGVLIRHALSAGEMR